MREVPVFIAAQRSSRLAVRTVSRRLAPRLAPRLELQPQPALRLSVLIIGKP